MDFIVQDLPANIANGKESLGQLNDLGIQSRVSFTAHDFTHPQPVQGADVYLLRMILHDWAYSEAVTILQQLVGAMRKHSRLLIMDTVLPRAGTLPLPMERNIRVRDLFMMQAFNSGERELDDWKALLSAAKPELRLIDVAQPFGSDMSILEVTLGDATVE